MKIKAEGWLFLIAVLAVGMVLFMPLPSRGESPPPLDQVRSATLVSALAWLLAAASFWGFKERFWPRDPRERRRLTNAIPLLVLQAMVLRTVFELATSFHPLPWSWLPPDGWVWFPWFLIPGLSGILLGGRLGVLVCLASALMLYLLANPGPWPLTGCLSSALVGILLLRRFPTRRRVLRAGTGSGGALGVVAAFQYGMQGAPVDALAAAILVPVLLGFLTALFALALLPLLEWALGEISDITLFEYGTVHPLLDQLRAEAPGTWHHSLNVADLAEKAAAQIGARALFCKTAALYHDIGKLKEPALFAENNDGPSPHDQLVPQASAEKIIAHVPYGLELARKHRLPKAFREIIAEHHGVSIVRFFYAKARQALPENSRSRVDRALFTYPGPPPSTRESGIIALADTVEAASQSFPSKSEPDLRGLVRKLLADRISEGELADCPLTLAELAKVEGAFVSWLKGRYHSRPAYPDAAVEVTDRALFGGQSSAPASPLTL